MTSPHEVLKELESVYGGKILNLAPGGLGYRLREGYMTPDDFRALFTVYDPHKSELPSLGTFITVRLTYLLLMDGLAPWAQKIAGNMTENLQVRDWLRAALYPAKHYTHDEALTTMRQSPQVRRVLIAGTLKEFGLVMCRGWADQADVLNKGGKNVVAEIILQHLIEADVAEVRAFLGATEVYDHTELVNVLGDLRLACADTARVRTPQLFLYHGHKLGLADEQLRVLYQWVIAAGHHFTMEQRYELVRADWLSADVQRFLLDVWRNDFEEQG